MHLNIKIVQRSQWSAKIPHRACHTACYRQRRITADERYSLLDRQSSHAGTVRGGKESRTEALLQRTLAV